MKLNLKNDVKSDHLYPVVQNGRWVFQDLRTNANFKRKCTTVDSSQRNSEMAPSWWMPNFEGRKNTKKNEYLSKEKVVKTPIDMRYQQNTMVLTERQERDLLEQKVKNKIMQSGDEKLKRF